MHMMSALQMCTLSVGTPPSVLLARIAELEERQASELLKAQKFREEVKRNPALRKEVELEARQQLETQRDDAFSRMEDFELHRLSGLREHKRFAAWRKQAKMELRQLRETERLNRENTTQNIDAILSASAKLAQDIANTGAVDESTPSGWPAYMTDILPITTPAAFALKYQDTPESWFELAAGQMISPPTCPPGKRFSLGEILQIPCKPEHYRWLKVGVGSVVGDDEK